MCGRYRHDVERGERQPGDGRVGAAGRACAEAIAGGHPYRALLESFGVSESQCLDGDPQFSGGGLDCLCRADDFLGQCACRHDRSLCHTVGDAVRVHPDALLRGHGQPDELGCD